MTDAHQDRAEWAERARTAETERARELIARFVADAVARGLVTAPLLVRAGDGRETYRTGVSGWYLRRDGSVGLGQDGAYYILVAPRSLRAAWRGIRLVPSDPPLQVGAGGRDGESVALATLLQLRLAAGDDWPILR